MSRRLRRFSVQLEPRQIDYTLLPAEDESAFSDLLTLAGQMGYFDSASRRITPEGWRRIEGLRAAGSSARQAFVAMHFATDLYAAWTDGFKPGIEASGFFSALRIDRKEFNNKIDDEIVSEIRRSGLLVADFTNQRQSVYFEAGFAMGLGIQVIYSCRDTDIDTVHFDARQYNHIVWITPADLATKLDLRIRATVLPLVR
jgi:hypothetical protein